MTGNERSEAVIVDLTNVDWPLLRTQKQWLVQQSDNDDAAGILHLIDEIQDQAAEQLGEETVFGFRPPTTRRSRKR